MRFRQRRCAMVRCCVATGIRHKGAFYDRLRRNRRLHAAQHRGTRDARVNHDTADKARFRFSDLTALRIRKRAASMRPRSQISLQQLSSWSSSRLLVWATCHLEPVQFLFDSMKGIVADLVVGTHGENGLPGRFRAARWISPVAEREAALRSAFVRSSARRAVNSCRTSSAIGDRSSAKLASPARNARSRAAAQLAADRIIVMQIERTQERLERQSLDRQRAEDDRERGQHDQVAIRKRRRKRHCRGKRDDAAHAGPRNDQSRCRWSAAASAAADENRTGGAAT